MSHGEFWSMKSTYLVGRTEQTIALEAPMAVLTLLAVDESIRIC